MKKQNSSNELSHSVHRNSIVWAELYGNTDEYEEFLEDETKEGCVRPSPSVNSLMEKGDSAN